MYIPLRKTRKKILGAIQEGEGLFQEFKISLEKIDRSIAAFANTQGGVIYLGVNDQGQRVGFQLTNRLKAQIQGTVRNMDPHPHVTGLEMIRTPFQPLEKLLWPTEGKMI